MSGMTDEVMCELDKRYSMLDRNTVSHTPCHIIKHVEDFPFLKNDSREILNKLPLILPQQSCMDIF